MFYFNMFIIRWHLNLKPSIYSRISCIYTYLTSFDIRSGYYYYYRSWSHFYPYSNLLVNWKCSSFKMHVLCVQWMYNSGSVHFSLQMFNNSFWMNMWNTTCSMPQIFLSFQNRLCSISFRFIHTFVHFHCSFGTEKEDREKKFFSFICCNAIEMRLRQGKHRANLPICVYRTIYLVCDKKYSIKYIYIQIFESNSTISMKNNIILKKKIIKFYSNLLCVNFSDWSNSCTECKMLVNTCDAYKSKWNQNETKFPKILEEYMQYTHW